MHRWVSITRARVNRVENEMHAMDRGAPPGRPPSRTAKSVNAYRIKRTMVTLTVTINLPFDVVFVLGGFIQLLVDIFFSHKLKLTLGMRTLLSSVRMA